MKKTAKIRSLSWLLIASLFIIGCEDDEFINFTSTISSEETFFDVEEGKDITFNINLTEELSEDLPLEMDIIRDLESGVYINPEDYQDYYEYSTDSGQNWKRVRPNRVIIPKRTKNLRVRLPTINDQKLEVDEEFSLKNSPLTGSVFNISGGIQPIKIIVRDNEESDENVDAYGLYFKRDANNNYNLTAINRGIEPHKVLKNYIDNGVNEQLIKDLKVLDEIGGIPVNYLDLVYTHHEEWAGFVFNKGQAESKDDWEMGLNLIYAYERFDENFQTYTETDYTTKGPFGFILVHEYGHILTLNVKEEVNPYIRNSANCNNLLIHEGCLHEKSVLNQFNRKFYINDDIYNEPNFVTDYAKTNIVEDIAETFAFYIGQNSINRVTEESSGALRKINFISENERLKDLKTQMINKLSSGQDFMDIYPSIRKLNRNHKGEPVSCIDIKQKKI